MPMQVNTGRPRVTGSFDVNTNANAVNTGRPRVTASFDVNTNANAVNTGRPRVTGSFDANTRVPRVARSLNGNRHSTVIPVVRYVFPDHSTLIPVVHVSPEPSRATLVPVK